MAISEQITVGATAVALAGPTKSGGPRVRLRNGGTTVSVYVGGNENTNLTLTNGLTLGPQQAVELVIGGNDAIFAFASASTVVEIFRSSGTAVG